MPKQKFSIRMLDLVGEYRSIKEEIDSSIARVIASGRYILGSEVAGFERELADYIGTGEGVGVASGTDALMLALQALGVGEGDEVIVPALTYISNAEVVAWLSAKPVFVDVGEDMNIDAGRVESALTERTRVVVAVHFNGLSADVDRLQEILSPRGVHLLEDCAQSLGATLNGRKAGSFGAVGCFSFFPAKNLGAYGDAGAVTSDNVDLVEEIRLIRSHYQRSRYQAHGLGYNSRLDAMQAAVLRVKLPHLNDWNAKRRVVAHLYFEGLADLTDKLILPRAPSHKEHVYYQYAITTTRRDELKAYLAEKGIESQIHYPFPLHTMPAYSHLGYGEGRFPTAERFCREVLSLPLYPLIPEEDVERVISAIRDFFK